MNRTDDGPEAIINSSVSGSHNRNVIIVGSYNNVSLASQPGLRLSKLHKLSGAGSTVAQQLTAFERRTRFVGRTSEFDQLQDWLKGPRPISVRTIVGPPGIGKTRLAIELADLAESQGWTSGFLRASELLRFVNAPGLSDWVWDDLTLVVVDYAAQKADALGLLFEHLQDVAQVERAPGSHKLRILLLEREASPQSGWWARAFGPSGQSDRRIELAEPQVPHPIDTLSEQTTLALIADTIGHAGKGSRPTAAAILSACLQSEESRQILGNPLLVQIATLSSLRKGTTELAFSTDALLGGIVDRERQLMREKWRKAKIPEALFKDLERLVALITLIQGATLRNVQDLVGSSARLSASFLSLERLIEALSDALTFDEVYGYRALEPDIVGDRFVAECEVGAELVLSAFKVDPSSLGPRLWRLLDEYQHDQRLGHQIAGWVRRVIEYLEDNFLALDVFVTDAPNAISGSAAQIYAEARSKITEGLRQGKSTQEILLLGPNHPKAESIIRSLIREGFYLTKSGNHDEAIKRYNAAISDMVANNFDQANMAWLWVHSYRAQSLQALGHEEERLGAVDEAIAVCNRLIEHGKFEEGAFVDETLKRLLEKIERTVISERAIRTVLGFSRPDVRITLAKLVWQRGSGTGTVSRSIVLDALAHLDDVTTSDVYSHLCNDAMIFRDAALRCQQIGEVGYAKELRRHQDHFQETAKSFLVDLLDLGLGLRQLALSSKQEDENEFGVELASGAFGCLARLIGKGVDLRPSHIITLSLIFVIALKPIAPTELYSTARTLTEADCLETKGDLAKQIASQLCSIAQEVGFLDKGDFRSVLLTAVSRMNV